MTLEERVLELERRVAVLERSRGFPIGPGYYPPLNDTRNPERGGLDSVMADEGYVVK